MEEYRNNLDIDEDTIPSPIVAAYPDFVTDYPDYLDSADGTFQVSGGSFTLGSGGDEDVDSLTEAQEELKEKIKQAVLDILNEESK